MMTSNRFTGTVALDNDTSPRPMTTQETGMDLFLRLRDQFRSEDPLDPQAADYKAVQHLVNIFDLAMLKVQQLEAKLTAGD